ncbi:MAG: NfeD family protein [Candidatus Helarchaeota archaeon]|nr:NfeD family protein [Candidatus Helarchaeota archaeon]
MFDSKLWRYIFLTAILEIIIIIVSAIIIIAFYPAISIYVVIGAIAIIVIYLCFSYYIYKPVVKHQKIDPQDEIIGQTGVAITDLSPRGQVKIRSRVWSARGTSKIIISGTKIKVIQMDGIQLLVEAIQE